MRWSWIADRRQQYQRPKIIKLVLRVSRVGSAIFNWALSNARCCACLEAVIFEQLLGSFLCGVCESTVSGEMCAIFHRLRILIITLKQIKALSS